MENPRAIVHAETQYKVALMTKETGLLEELPYECPSPSDHHSDDQFATCSSSITYAYEATAIIDPSKNNNFPPTVIGEGSPVEREFQVTLTSAIVSPNRCMNVLGPAEKCGHLQNDVNPTTKPSPKAYPYGDIDGLSPLEGDAVHSRHIRLTPINQTPIPFPAPSRSNGCDTPPSSIPAGRWYRGVNLDHPTHQNSPQIPDCPNDPDRTGMSCTSVYLGLHQFSPHTNWPGVIPRYTEIYMAEE